MDSTKPRNEVVLAAREVAHAVALRAVGVAFARSEEDEVRAVADQALLEAWERFDRRRECAFSTYAYPWVRGAALRFAARARWRTATRRAFFEAGGNPQLEPPMESTLDARRALRHVPYRDRGLVFRHVVLEGTFEALAGEGSAPALSRRFHRAMARARGSARRRW